jgi:hypothetical protein
MAIQQVACQPFAEDDLAIEPDSGVDDDPLNPARGILFGVALCVPLWAAVLWVLW